MRRPGRVTPLLVGALAGAAVTSPASAAPQRATVADDRAVPRACHVRLAGDRAGTDLVRTRAGKAGLVRARLRGQGDWDLGVFDARTGRSVAGSAGFGSRELAEGFVSRGQRLVVQACRYRGAARSARLTISYVGLRRSGRAGRTQVVDVVTRRRADKERLQELGLDLTEHGDRDSLEVVLHGRADAARLRRAGFAYSVRIADLRARTAANRRADVRFARRRGGSDLPSGRDSYRRLADYELELKELARRYKSLVKPLTLNRTTRLGRPVYGIEIARRPERIDDGKPIFLNMGAHHAREWPSSEHALEWAYDLLRGYGRERRTRRLVTETRTIVVPVVNPDGFNISREGSRPPGTEPFDDFDYEMKRKNCWPDPAHPGPCEANPTAGRLLGVDLNRNYGGFWGGAGASVDSLDDTFRGPAPFSEPETLNIKELVGSRQVTNLISNHTYSNLVLRPPGVADVGFPLEEPQLKALGQRMADHNGYANDPSFQLYDTTGATEDWTFWTAGGLGYTFEIGPSEFHPRYELGVVGEYLGRGFVAGNGKGGNREAYFEMLEATADDSLHSVLTGRARAGDRLRISKEFQTATSPVWQDDLGQVVGEPILFPDRLESELEVRGGRFEWDVNPSTRPVVRGRFGRDATGPSQAAAPLANPPGFPAENTSYPEGDGAVETIPFTVQGPAQGVDNGRLQVRIAWANPETDWDLYVLDAAGETVTSSASFGDTDEEAILFDPPPGAYRAIVVNYDQVAEPPDDWTAGEVTFQGPRPLSFGPQEAWNLTCTDRRGREVGAKAVVVDRGQRVDVGDVCARGRK